MGGHPAHGGGQPGAHLLHLLHSYGDQAGALGRDMVTPRLILIFSHFNDKHRALINILRDNRIMKSIWRNPTMIYFVFKVFLRCNMLLSIEDQTLRARIIS